MKISFLSAAIMAVLILASCAKEDDSPIQESRSEIHENSNKSKVKIADASWYITYRDLLTNDNVLYEYIMDGTLSETELIALNDARINGTLEITDLSAFLTNAEAIELRNYFIEVNNHLANTQFDDSFESDAKIVHIAAVNYWKAKLPNTHWAKATDCEEDAAEAAVTFLGAGLAYTVGATLVSGPVAPVSLIGGVVGSIFGSVATWAIAVSDC